MKTAFIFPAAFVFAMTLTAGKCNEIEHFQTALQNAIDNRSESSLRALFNFDDASDAAKEKFGQAITNILALENPKVEVQPFEGKRKEEFAKAETVLNGTPKADVFFQTSANHTISMIAGSTAQGFRILLPKSLPNVGSDDLTAAKLAHHLGISFWTSKARLEGADYNLQIIHVRDGKEVEPVLSGSLFATDREFTRLAIQASLTANGMKFSMQPEAAPKVANESAVSIPLHTICPLPRIFAEGDHVLGGDIPLEALKRFHPDKSSLNIGDIKDGLLLRVTKNKGQP